MRAVALEMVLRYDFALRLECRVTTRFPSRTVVVVHKHLQPVRALVSYNVGSSNEPGTSLKPTVGA